MPRKISEKLTRKEMIDPQLDNGFEKFIPNESCTRLQEEFTGVVARVESLRERMGESARQVEGLFESLLAEPFS